MPFYSGLSLGGGGLGGADAGRMPQGYDQFLQQLLQQFPGLSSLQAGAQGSTTGAQGYNFGGTNLYSGQAASGGGLYGSTGTGLFEGAQAGQPESITGGLASGYLGKSASQAPLSNTGIPGTSAGGGAAPLGGAGAYSALLAPGSQGLSGPDLTQWAQADASNLLGAPAQQYDVLGPVKQVLGAGQAGFQQVQQQQQPSPISSVPTGAISSGFGGGGGLTGFTPEDLGTMQELLPPQSLGTFEGGSPLYGNPTTVAGGGGSGGAGMAGGGSSLLGSAFDQISPMVGQGLGAIGGAAQLAQGIMSGNPAGAALGGLQAASNVSSLFGGPTIGSLISNLLPQTATEAAIAGAGGAGEAGALAAGAIDAGASGAGALAGVVATPFTIALTNWLSGIGPPSGKLSETNNIRRDFGTAWPQLQGAGPNFDQMLQALQTLPPDQQAQMLPQVIAAASQAQGATSAVSQFLSTQGGRHGAQSSEGLGMGDAPGVAPLDVSAYEQVSGPLTMRAILAELAARDRLAQMGQPYDEAQNNHDPYFWLNALQSQGGVSGGTFYNPQQQAVYAQDNPDTAPFAQPTADEITRLMTPGSQVQGLGAIFSRLNPQFAHSPLAGMLGQLQPYLGGQMPQEALPILARQRAAAAQRAILDRQTQEQMALASMGGGWDTGGGG